MEPILCKAYDKTPREIGALSPGEIAVMMHGIDWERDREWALASLPLVEKPGDYRALHYPRFRVKPEDRVVFASSGSRATKTPTKRSRFG